MSAIGREGWSVADEKKPVDDKLEDDAAATEDGAMRDTDASPDTADEDGASAAEYLAVCGPHYTQQPGNLFDERRAIRHRELTVQFVGETQPTMDLTGDPARIAVPTLVLAGGLDPVCPIEIMTEIAEAIDPDLVRFEVFEECGHGVFRDDPDGGFAAVRSFVEAQSSRLVGAG